MYKIITLKANAKKTVTWKCIWHHICTKLLLWRQMLRKSLLLKCIWHQICTKLLLYRQMPRKSLLENACGTTYVQNCYFAGKCSGNCYFKFHLTPNMYKIVTLKVNAKEIITVKSVWHHICTKSLLWRQMLRKSLLENACGTIYVQNHYFAGKCSGNRYLKMHLTPNIYKNITLKANAKEIITWKCIWHQIRTKLLL